MNWKRSVAAAILSLTGLGLLLVAGRHLLSGTTGVAGIIIAGATLVLGVAFAASGPWLYRSDVEPDHLLRVAGWNTLGVVVTTAVVALVLSFQAATGGRVSAPLLSGAVIVGVSAFAHVLIGFNDVRRIRARTVAKQRQRAAVVNRFVRHDLRHLAQLLLGYGQQLRDEEATADLGEKVTDIGYDLVETQEQIKIIDNILEGDSERYPLDVAALVEEQRDEWTEAHPDATLTVEMESGLTALAGEHLESALTELVENACTYGGDPPRLTVRGTRTDDTVHIAVLDNGEGLPEDERALINHDRIETQLQHSSGLGLWLTKWIVEQYGGDITVGTRDDEAGGKVTMRLPAAENRSR